MRNYIISRVVKSFVAIIVVVSIVIVMIYTMIPRENVLRNDEGYKKLSGDQRTTYVMTRFEELGYHDYETVIEMCTNESEDYDSCIVTGSEENERVAALYESRGYTIEQLRNGNIYAYRDYNPLELIWNFFSDLIVIDHPNVIQDETNPELDQDRGYYLGTGPNGMPAIMCSGCQYKYQLYFDSSFPFIHTNAIRFDFGDSFPTSQGVPVLQVISQGQGSQEPVEQTFPNGTTQNSAINQYTCQYKPITDSLDSNRFDDKYADCLSYYENPSMIGTSYLFGVIALIFSYIIALPAGILMARKKGKFADKVGIVVINFLIAVPSLALIFFVRQIGSNFNFPDRFPILGFENIRSYIIPIIILVLLQIPSLMTWMRRYMIDQSNADYAKFAKAKGLSQKEIFTKHILKNAIIPIVNGIPSSIILCISGALITETAFAIPGMGKMLPDAIKVANNNMVICLVFIFTTLSIIAVLVGDLLMTVVDPRIQLAAKGGKKK